MSEKMICQSCGMPMKESDYGTNQDGSANSEYCVYCFANGAFIKDETIDEMTETCIPFVKEQFPNNDEARKAIKAELKTLKRWRA